MTNAGLVLIAIAGAVHLGIFLIESVLWTPLRTWRLFGIRDPAVADASRRWALNQGFYNLFLAIGAIGGGIAHGVMSYTFNCVQWTPDCAAKVARADLSGVPGLVVAGFSAACMVGAAIVLLASSGRRALVPALVQGAPPLAGLVLILGAVAV